MTPTQFIQHLSPQLFWDVRRDSVDPKSHGRFLIARIMDRGTWEDVQAAREFFSEAEIREALLEARSLSRKTISYFALQYGIPRETFRAYTHAFQGTWP